MFAHADGVTTSKPQRYADHHRQHQRPDRRPRSIEHRQLERNRLRYFFFAPRGSRSFCSRGSVAVLLARAALAARRCRSSRGGSTRSTAAGFSIGSASAAIIGSGSGSRPNRECPQSAGTATGSVAIRVRSPVSSFGVPSKLAHPCGGSASSRQPAQCERDRAQMLDFGRRASTAPRRGVERPRGPTGPFTAAAGRCRSRHR